MEEDQSFNGTCSQCGQRYMGEALALNQRLEARTKELGDELGRSELRIQQLEALVEAVQRAPVLEGEE